MKRTMYALIVIGVLGILSIISTAYIEVSAGCNDGPGAPTPTPYPTSGGGPTPDPGIPWKSATPVPYPTSNPQTPVPTPFEVRFGHIAYATDWEQPCPPTAVPSNSSGSSAENPPDPDVVVPENNICYPQRGLAVGLAALVTSDGARLRNGAGTNHGVITGLNTGDTVTIIGNYRCGSGHTWWQIQYGDLTGWMAEVNLEIIAVQSPVTIVPEITEEPNPADPETRCTQLSAYTDFYKNKRSLIVYYPDTHPLAENLRVYFWNGTLGQWEPVPNNDWGINFTAPQLFSNGWSYYFIATRWYWIDGSHTLWNVDEFWAVYYCS